MQLLQKYNSLRRNNSLLIWNNFYQKIIFIKLFETIGIGIIPASFTEVQCQDTDTFDFIPVQIIEIFIQGSM